MRKRKLVGVLGAILFSVGVLLAIVLIGISVWADLEAVLFNPQPRQFKPFRGLRCPIVMTTEETRTIRARFKNTLDESTEFFIRAYISHGYVTLRREVITELPLDPGEVEVVEWAIDKEDAAFERLVLFRMTVRGAYPLPNRQGTCGVLMVDMPSLTGRQIVTILLVGGLVCMVTGGALWLTTNPHVLNLQVQVTRAMGFLTISTLAGLLTSLLGWWVPGAIFLVVTVLAIGVIIGHFANPDAPS